MRSRIVAICLLLTLVSCAVNPVTGKNELGFISREKEIQMGEDNYPSYLQYSGGVYHAHPQINQYVSRVGARLAAVSDRELPYEFAVINDSSVNAWALPGGKIAIHRGLLESLKSEAELAAVLGHEITHAAAKHSAQQLQTAALMGAGLTLLSATTDSSDNQTAILLAASVGAQLASLSFSRQDELEADHYGMIYMARAGYDPKAAVSLQEMFLSREEGKANAFERMLSTHPPSKERLDENRQHAAMLTVGNPYLGEKAYQDIMGPLLKAIPAYEMYEQAAKAFKEKRYNDAHEALDEALDIEWREGLFYHLKAKVYFAQAEWDEALEAANGAITRDGNYHAFYITRAEIYEAMEQWRLAEDDYARALNLLQTDRARDGLDNAQKKQRQLAA